MSNRISGLHPFQLHMITSEDKEMAYSYKEVLQFKDLHIQFGRFRKALPRICWSRIIHRPESSCSVQNESDYSYQFFGRPLEEKKKTKTKTKKKIENWCFCMSL